MPRSRVGCSIARAQCSAVRLCCVPAPACIIIIVVYTSILIPAGLYVMYFFFVEQDL